MFPILLGLALLGAAIISWLYFRELKRSAGYREQAELAQQEKLIVVDFMHDMAQALADGLNKEELFQRIVHASIVSTGALSACIFEKTPENTLRGVAVQGLFPPHRPLSENVRAKLATRAKYLEKALRSEEFPISEGVAGEVARTGKAMLIENGREDPRIVKHDDPALAVTTAICAPIAFGGEVLGVLAVCNSSDGLPFSATDFSVVQSLAEQSAVAVRNNDFLTLQLERKQIDVDLALARSIQLMLLPQTLPDVEGVQIDARYVSSHSIGGDLYDVFRLGDRVFGVAVADVSGKGIPASIVMAICRTNLHRFAQEERSPANVLKAVNRVMAGELKEGMYVSMIYAVVDLDKGEIVYARAGHERPMICRAEHERGTSAAAYPESEGMPVGMVGSDIFDEWIQENTLSFESSDVFVIYTDGLIEMVNAEGEEYSASRLAEVVKTLRKRSAREINAGVLESLERFSGKRRYDDDLTLVTIKRG